MFSLAEKLRNKKLNKKVKTQKEKLRQGDAEMIHDQDGLVKRIQKEYVDKNGKKLLLS